MKTSPALLLILASYVLAGCTSVKQAEQAEQKHWYCVAGEQKQWRCGNDSSAYSALVKAPAQTDTVEPVETVEFKDPDSENLDFENIESENIDSDSFESESFDSDKAAQIAEIQEPESSTEPSSTEPLSVEPFSVELPSSELQPSADSEQSTDLIGPWLIQLAAYSEYQNAQKLANSVDNAKVIATRIKGKDYFNVLLDGLADQASAQSQANDIQQQIAIKPWPRSLQSLQPFIR